LRVSGSCHWAGWSIFAFALTLSGCSTQEFRDGTIAPSYNSLRNFVYAYSSASARLGRPPKTAAEFKSAVAKTGANADELLRSPANGSELVVHWGVDLKSLRSADGRLPIWVYEKRPVNGKRWVVQERYPAELTEQEFRDAAFAPGFKPN
jgi:hypothetical protein